jgi:hypothetical protein
MRHNLEHNMSLLTRTPAATSTHSAKTLHGNGQRPSTSSASGRSPRLRRLGTGREARGSANRTVERPAFEVCQETEPMTGVGSQVDPEMEE